MDSEFDYFVKSLVDYLIDNYSFDVADVYDFEHFVDEKRKTLDLWK